jgi:RNase H-fold protein (predicted Holliday junction resolvase)
MSRNYILRSKIFRPIVPDEVYALQTTEQAFPGGEWVEEPPVVIETTVAPASEAFVSGVKALAAPSSNITICGDTKDLEPLLELLEGEAPDTVVVGRLPSGRGAESKAAKALEEHGVEVHYVDSPLVEAVMSYDLTSPVILLGSGGRVKEARSWLARANWGRKVIQL